MDMFAPVPLDPPKLNSPLNASDDDVVDDCGGFATLDGVNVRLGGPDPDR